MEGEDLGFLHLTWFVFVENAGGKVRHLARNKNMKSEVEKVFGNTGFLLILAVILFLAIVLASCGDGGNVFDGDEGVQPGQYSTNYAIQSPQGVTIYSGRPINSQIPPLAEEGLKKVLRIASERYGYTQGLSIGAYQVALHPRSSKCINAGFLLIADGSPLYPNGWDNHPTYDKDPKAGRVRLCVAGMIPPVTIFEAVSSESYLLIVVDDVGIMPTITRFESEHWLTLLNDIEKYKQTAGVHAHPILPDKDGSLLEPTLPSYKEEWINGTPVYLTQ